MGWLNMIQSFADGTLVEDTIKQIDEGLDGVEKLIGQGEKHIETLANNLEKGAQTIVDGADKAVASTDKVIDVVNKFPTKD